MYPRKESRVRRKRETSRRSADGQRERERKCEREKKRSALGKEGVGSSVSYWTRLASAEPKRPSGSLGNANRAFIPREHRSYRGRIFFLNFHGTKLIFTTLANVSTSKMVSVERTAMIIFGLALFVTSGSALRCWVCSSNVNVMCNDPMNTTDHQATFHIRTCDPGPYGSSKPICRKIVKREYGERVIIRQCSTPYHDEIDVVDGKCGNSMTQPGRDVIESCHICSTDLCNSATDASATRPLYAAMMILLACTFHQSKYIL